MMCHDYNRPLHPLSPTLPTWAGMSSGSGKRTGSDVDVMDGMFVSNISIGVPVVKSLRKFTDQFLDVHLMIEKPVRYVDAFADAGADLLTVHLEADMPPAFRRPWRPWSGGASGRALPCGPSPRRRPCCPIWTRWT
ncbi:MAG: hypothetical protein ACLR1T_14235 [Evtepia gabavorous]